MQSIPFSWRDAAAHPLGHTTRPQQRSWIIQRANGLGFAPIDIPPVHESERDIARMQHWAKGLRVMAALGADTCMDGWQGKTRAAKAKSWTQCHAAMFVQLCFSGVIGAAASLIVGYTYLAHGKNAAQAMAQEWAIPLYCFRYGAGIAACMMVSYGAIRR